MGKIPFWFRGVIICFIIYLAANTSLHVGLEKYLSQSIIYFGVGDLEYSIPLFIINFIIIPTILLISIILSFLKTKEKNNQFERKYLLFTFFIIATVLIINNLFFPYLFPVTYHTNLEACSKNANHRLDTNCVYYFCSKEGKELSLENIDLCLYNSAIKTKNPSLCNGITISSKICKCYVDVFKQGSVDYSEANYLYYENNSQECVNYVYPANLTCLAASEKNESYCDKIE